VPTEYRVRILRLIENMTLGRNSVGYLTESLHGAGSPQAQRIQIYRQMQLDFKQGLAKRLAGVNLPDSVVDELAEMADGYFARVFTIKE
jgi:4-hydroxybutyryl-CoA dehydratase/vinylacetyl-CoA-Delta-isomerase